MTLLVVLVVVLVVSGAAAIFGLGWLITDRLLQGGERE